MSTLSEASNSTNWPSYIHICICRCMYVCVYVCICVYTHIHIYKYRICLPRGHYHSPNGQQTTNDQPTKRPSTCTHIRLYLSMSCRCVYVCIYGRLLEADFVISLRVKKSQASRLRNVLESMPRVIKRPKRVERVRGPPASQQGFAKDGPPRHIQGIDPVRSFSAQERRRSEAIIALAVRTQSVCPKAQTQIIGPI
jgi:hypothetical protein